MFNQKLTVCGCSLSLLRPGERGVIAHLRSQDETLLQKLGGMGLTPGTPIVVEQRSPTCLLRLGSDRLSLSRETTSAIYVHLIACQTAPQCHRVSLGERLQLLLHRWFRKPISRPGLNPLRPPHPTT